MATLTPGQMVRESREAAGLTRERLAVLSDTSVATIARLENQDAIPSFPTMARIASHIPLDLDNLAEATR